MYSEFINKILVNASGIANKSFGNVSSTVKPEDNNQVLTETDLEIGKYIVSECQKDYPNYNVIDEEAGVIDRQSEYTWVIDPIDGTSNFANGLSEYGIILGLLKGGTPIVGGISLPFFNQIYIAEKGSGAFCNGLKISVSKEESLLKNLVVYQINGYQDDPEFTRSEVKLVGEIILNIRNLRTTNSVYDFGMVASGKYGAILNQTSKIWDNVGQQIILEEAGGVYTDFYGNKMNYTNPLSKAKDNFTYAAGAPVLHKKLMDIIGIFK